MANRPDLMIISDLHLRDDQPTCRMDDFWEVQIRKLKWINKEWKRLARPDILCAGDVFHKAKPSPKLLTTALEFLPGRLCRRGASGVDKLIYTIPGNHDLPNHNINQLNESGLAPLAVTERISSLIKRPVHLYKNINEHHSENVADIHPFPFGSKPLPLSENLSSKDADKRRYVALAHLFTYKDRKPWADCKSPPCAKVLDLFRGYDLVITGDNHQSFTHQNKRKQLLVNPGCMSRQNLNEIDYKPSIYLWYAEENRVEQKEIPIEKNVFSDEHIKHQKEREKRECAFVESLSADYEVSLSFEENLKRFAENNPDVPDSVMWRVWEAIKGE